MRLSGVIKEFEKALEEYGDVEVYKAYNDGQATYAVQAWPTVEYKEIWKNHSDGKRYYITV